MTKLWGEPKYIDVNQLRNRWRQCEWVYNGILFRKEKFYTVLKTCIYYVIFLLINLIRLRQVLQDISDL